MGLQSEQEEDDNPGIPGFGDQDSSFSDHDLDSWVSLLFSQSWRVRFLALDAIRMAMQADQVQDQAVHKDQDAFEHEVRVPLSGRLLLKGAFHAVVHLLISLTKGEPDLDLDAIPSRRSICLLTLGLLWDEGLMERWPPSKVNYDTMTVRTEGAVEDAVKGGIVGGTAPSSPLPHSLGGVETPHDMIQDAWCLASYQTQVLEGSSSDSELQILEKEGMPVDGARLAFLACISSCAPEVSASEGGPTTTAFLEAVLSHGEINACNSDLVSLRAFIASLPWTRSKHKKLAVDLSSRGNKTETFTNRLRMTVMALIISARSSLDAGGTGSSAAPFYLPVEVIERISMELSWFCIHSPYISGGMMLVEHQDGDSEIENLIS